MSGILNSTHSLIKHSFEKLKSKSDARRLDDDLEQKSKAVDFTDLFSSETDREDVTEEIVQEWAGKSTLKKLFSPLFRIRVKSAVKTAFEALKISQDFINDPTSESRKHLLEVLNSKINPKDYHIYKTFNKVIRPIINKSLEKRLVDSLKENIRLLTEGIDFPWALTKELIQDFEKQSHDIDEQFKKLRSFYPDCTDLPDLEKQIENLKVGVITKTFRPSLDELFKTPHQTNFDAIKDELLNSASLIDIKSGQTRSFPAVFIDEPITLITIGNKKRATENSLLLKLEKELKTLVDDLTLVPLLEVMCSHKPMLDVQDIIQEKLLNQKWPGTLSVQREINHLQINKVNENEYSFVYDTNFHLKRDKVKMATFPTVAECSLLKKNGKWSLSETRLTSANENKIFSI